MNVRCLRILSVLFSALSLVSCTGRKGYVTLSGYAQGGVYAVKLNMEGVKLSPEEISADIDSILREVDFSLSGYNRSSLLSRFNAGEEIVPDSLFMDIYAKAHDIYERTGGCVDVSSAPLFDLWGFGFGGGGVPEDSLLEQTLARCGMWRLKKDISLLRDADGFLSSSDLSVCGQDTPPMLNYNAIAQGYSCDLVAGYLYSIGVRDMLVDIGEIYCDGMNPSGRRWTIGIDRPSDDNAEPGRDLQAVFEVPSGAHGVVTSGNYRKFYIRDGKKYAHTVDPRTGRPVEHNLLSATVLAENATIADAYATFCMVIGLEPAKDFVLSSPDVEACLIYDDEGKFSVWTSPGFVLSD